MKQSFSMYERHLRTASLEAEKKCFEALKSGNFILKKDTGNDPTVVWEGVLGDSSLKKKYRIRIVYDKDYPYKRPKVFPLDKKIKDNRHQNATDRKTLLPGDICIFQDALDDWVVGTDCNEIIQRAITWFVKYENKTLDKELAPPEIERYYETSFFMSKPKIIISEKLVNISSLDHGSFALVYLKSNDFAFLVTNKNEDEHKYLKEETLSISSVMFKDDPINDKKNENGHWFKVDKEPFNPLLTTVFSLIDFISNNIKSLSQKQIIHMLTIESFNWIALCYPVPSGGFRWLVFRCFLLEPKSIVPGFRKFKSHKSIMMHNRNNRVKINITKHITLDSIFKRTSINDFQSLKYTKILILGCGTIGSKVADNLVMAGVQNISIADSGILEAGNICRHVLGIDSVTKPKVESMKEHLLRKNPFLNITSINKNILLDRELFSSTISHADMVISCIGRDSVETWINECAMYHGKPVLFCRSYAKAILGEILLARKGKCCFRCAGKHLGESSCIIPRPPTFDVNEYVGYDTDCGAVFIPGSGLDIDFIAMNCTRMTINYLSGIELDTDYWLIRGRAINEEIDWKPPDELSKEYTVLGYMLKVDSGCPSCGN